MNSHKVFQLMRKNINNIILVAIFIVVIFPVVWVFLTSFKSGKLVFDLPPVWIFNPTLDNYKYLLFESRFALGVNILQNMKNSIIVAFGSTLLAILASMYAGYALSRFRFKGKKSFSLFIIATRMLPPIGTMIPFFLLINSLHLIDTYSALIIAYTALNIPLATWMLRGFLDEIPTELDEAAIIDGCGNNKTLWTIIAPLSAPGLMATSIFSFVLSWNDFTLANVLTKREARTLPLVVSSFLTEEGVQWGPLSAAAMLVFLPPIIFFCCTYKHLAKGLTLGAVKG